MLWRGLRRGLSGVARPGVLLGLAILAILAYAGTTVREGPQYGFTESAVSSPREVLWFAVICGLASMATLEVAKELFGLRGIYQRHQIAFWLQQRAPNDEIEHKVFGLLLSAMGIDQTACNAEDRQHYRAERRAAKNQKNNLFALPIEQLAAQISIAVDFALSNPRRYSALLGCLAAEHHVPGAGQGRTRHKDVGGTELRLAQRVHAGVDHMQISVGERWRRYVRGTAVLVSGFYGIFLAKTKIATEGAEFSNILTALIIGGLLSWIFRDLAAAIERWRR